MSRSLLFCAVVVVQASAAVHTQAETPCCNTCTAPTVKYWANDKPNNECAEACINPQDKLRLVELFVLTAGKGAQSTVANPCRDAYFSTYSRTDSIGAGTLEIKLDKYSPSAAPLPTSPKKGVTVYRLPHYTTEMTKNVLYAKTLVHCTNQTNQATCQEASMYLDVWQPTNTSDGPFPIVISAHGGGFVSGIPTQDPQNDYFAQRGFVAFSIQYRLDADKGLYPAALTPWKAANAQPNAHWQPWVWQMYPAVRDIKAALRWVHANAATYNADTSSITLQGGSAGATAMIELGLTGGLDQTFAGDYTGELDGHDGGDRTLVTTNLDQPATATGLISYWGAIFSEDLMHYKDGNHRWSSSSVPTIAFHGTADTTVSPVTGDVLCGNLTAVGVPCRKVSLPGQQHGCWNALVDLPGGGTQSIFDYAFDAMANMSNWTVIGPAPGTCVGKYKQCGGKDWKGPTCCTDGCTCTGTVYHKQCRPTSANMAKV